MINNVLNVCNGLTMICAFVSQRIFLLRLFDCYYSDKIVVIYFDRRFKYKFIKTRTRVRSFRIRIRSESLFVRGDFTEKFIINPLYSTSPYTLAQQYWFTCVAKYVRFFFLIYQSHFYYLLNRTFLVSRNN